MPLAHHPVKVHDQHDRSTSRAQFDAKVAVFITGKVGTMSCAYVFALIALISLPAALATGQVIIIVAWVAQTFLQLVLLSIIMVGQGVQAKAADKRSEQEFANTVAILDRLDTKTAGGLKDVLDALPKKPTPKPKPKPASKRRVTKASSFVEPRR